LLKLLNLLKCDIGLFRNVIQTSPTCFYRMSILNAYWSTQISILLKFSISGVWSSIRKRASEMRLKWTEVKTVVKNCLKSNLCQNLFEKRINPEIWGRPSELTRNIAKRLDVYHIFRYLCCQHIYRNLLLSFFWLGYHLHYKMQQHCVPMYSVVFERRSFCELQPEHALALGSRK
jgi:hypothetical protein